MTQKTTRSTSLHCHPIICLVFSCRSISRCSRQRFARKFASFGCGRDQHSQELGLHYYQHWTRQHSVPPRKLTEYCASTGIVRYLLQELKCYDIANVQEDGNSRTVLRMGIENAAAVFGTRRGSQYKNSDCENGTIGLPIRELAMEYLLEPWTKNIAAHRIS